MNNQDLKIGTLLHRSTYRIEQVLGQGSFGITYLATHVALNKKVAIKEFFMKDINGRSEDGSITGMSDGSLSKDYARKFRKEALNLASLEHPNIVHVTDSFEENGTFYYVMDYIDGENLNDYIKLHPVSQQEAVGIIRAVANALQYMHEEKHMLHLDLKPGNIMRRASDGHIFLIDFGLSKHYGDDGQPETSTTIGLGTSGYAPIEQANQAKDGEFRPTIDVYALGATFYKLLTHETPPPASELVSDDELLTNKLNEHNIDSNLSAIVINAMLPNVKKRIPTARAFANDVTSTLAKSNKAEEKEETQTADAPANNIAGSSEMSPKPEEEKERTRTANASKNGTKTGKEPNVSKIEEEKKQRLVAILSALAKSNKAEEKEETQTADAPANNIAGSSEMSPKPEEEKEQRLEASVIWLVFVAIIVAIIAIVPSAKHSRSTLKEITTIYNDSIELAQGKCAYTGYINANAMPDGPYGYARFDDGRIYRGSFVNGTMSDTTGTARFSFPNGDTYVGSFVNDHFSEGKYTVNVSGEYFVGKFDAEGQPQQGTWYNNNGNVIENIKN